MDSPTVVDPPNRLPLDARYRNSMRTLSAIPHPLSDARNPQNSEIRSRLATFDAQGWSVQVPGLTPLDCARHGWAVAAPNVLHCASCRNSLAVLFDERLGDSQRHVLAAHYREQLSAAHAATCYWSRGVLPDPSLSPLPQKELVDSFFSRVQTYPFLLMLQVHPIPVTSDVLQRVTRLCAQHFGWSTLTEGHSSAILLSLLGWRYDLYQRNQHLFYGNQARASTDSSSGGPTYGKRQREEEETEEDEDDGERCLHCVHCQRRCSPGAFGRVDAVGEHKSFCPWLKQWEGLVEALLHQERAAVDHEEATRSKKRSREETVDGEEVDADVQRWQAAVRKLRRALA
jgi:ferredoxin